MPRLETVPGTDIRATPQQRAWAEAVAAGLSGTEAAARARGYASLDEARKTGALAAVKSSAKDYAASKGGRAYLAHLTREAAALAQANTGQAIATLSEALATASTIMRARLGDFLNEDGSLNRAALRGAPAGVVKEYVVDVVMKDGRPVERTHFKLESALSAAQTLVRHYDSLNEPAAALNFTAVLVNAPQPVRDAIRWVTLQMLRGERPALPAGAGR